MEFPKLIEFPSKRKSITTKIKKEKWKLKMKKMHELFNVWMMDAVFYRFRVDYTYNKAAFKKVSYINVVQTFHLFLIQTLAT